MQDDDDDTEGELEGDDDDDDSIAGNPERGPLHGILMGPPFALATDCGLVQRNDDKHIPGCCACLSCDACGQLFRIDLLSTKGNHACPKCRLEYTSALIVATADDHTMLQYALDTVLRAHAARAEGELEDGPADDQVDDQVDDDQVDGDVKR